MTDDGAGLFSLKSLLEDEAEGREGDRHTSGWCGTDHVDTWIYIYVVCGFPLSYQLRLGVFMCHTPSHQYT